MAVNINIGDRKDADNVNTTDSIFLAGGGEAKTLNILQSVNINSVKGKIFMFKWCRSDCVSFQS